MADFIGITKSKLRQKLLTYFFTNPHAELYLREIAYLLNEDVGNLSKELLKLQKADIFNSTIRGRQKYFSINRNSPLYDELRSIIFKTVGVEGALREVVAKTDGVILSFVYGSFAKNRQSASSDIDLLVVGNPDEDKFMLDIEKLEKRLQREINYNIFSQREFRQRVLKKDSFLANIIKRPKIILKGSIDDTI